MVLLAHGILDMQDTHGVALACAPSPNYVPPESTGNCQNDYLVKIQHLPLRSTSVSATPYLPTCGPPRRLTQLYYFPIHSPYYTVPYMSHFPFFNLNLAAIIMSWLISDSALLSFYCLSKIGVTPIQHVLI
jgi:hypothetical protein